MPPWSVSGAGRDGAERARIARAAPARQLPGLAMRPSTQKAGRSRMKIEARLALADPALGRVIEAVIARIGPQRIAPSRATPFEALVRGVVYQSVSAKAAKSIFGRLKQTVMHPLTPSKVVALPPQAISRQVCRTRRRGPYEISPSGSYPTANWRKLCQDFPTTRSFTFSPLSRASAHGRSTCF
jgi:3-methyladenine DNA glycosylase/8-oxoguanine DNA glycosylase